MADVYRTFAGFVKFDPKEQEAGGKDVRQIVFRACGVKEQAMDIRATLWPSLEHAPVEKGDWVEAEGKFSVNTKDDKKYYNLSVNTIRVNGVTYQATKAETTEDDDADDESY